MLGGLGSDRGLLCRDKDLSALCRDRNSVSRQGLGLGQDWVTTKVSLCRDRVFPRVGHSFRDIRFYVATGFSKVVLRQGVFLFRPIGHAWARNKVLGTRMTGLGARMSARTSDGAACATELPMYTACA